MSNSGFTKLFVFYCVMMAVTLPFYPIGMESMNDMEKRIFLASFFALPFIYLVLWYLWSYRNVFYYGLVHHPVPVIVLGLGGLILKYFGEMYSTPLPIIVAVSPILLGMITIPAILMSGRVRSRY